jgi:hypothetical protein
MSEIIGKRRHAVQEKVIRLLLERGFCVPGRARRFGKDRYPGTQIAREAGRPSQ